MISAATFNFVIIAMIAIICLVFLSSLLRGNRQQTGTAKIVDPSKYTIKAMVDHVKEQVNDFINSNLYDLALSEDEFKKRTKQKERLQNSLKTCSTGSLPDKIYVKEFISDLLARTYNINEKNINLILPFDQPNRLTHQDQFEILLHHYKKKHGNDAFVQMCEEYDLTRLKKVIEDGEEESYIILGEEIADIYREKIRHLTFEDKFNIIVQRIYQKYRGLGVIDEIRDMNIDGYSGGVSGDLPKQATMIEDDIQILDAMKESSGELDSIWVVIKGKMIHLSFLSFENQNELIRVCQLLYKHNHPGQLSQKEGYKINNMSDDSRIVVMRPPFAQSWAFFGRKFDLDWSSLEELILGKNNAVVIELIKFLMKGQRVTGITGPQGAGKTTTLTAMVKYISPTLPIRTIETFFELHLRKRYPGRNIFGIQETPYISGQEGADAFTKVDGKVGIFGEIATDPVASWAIQNFQKSFLFAIFTHHAKSTEFLVNTFVNSLMNGSFSNEDTAEDQVINAIHFNVHLEHERNGNRYVEHITEIVPVDHQDLYAAFINASTFEEQRELWMRTSFKRKKFAARRIVEYRDGEYVVVNPPSERTLAEMKKRMTAEEVSQFNQFIEKHFSGQTITETKKTKAVHDVSQWGLV